MLDEKIKVVKAAIGKLKSLMETREGYHDEWVWGLCNIFDTWCSKEAAYQQEVLKSIIKDKAKKQKRFWNCFNFETTDSDQFLWPSTDPKPRLKWLQKELKRLENLKLKQNV